MSDFMDGYRVMSESERSELLTKFSGDLADELKRSDAARMAIDQDNERLREELGYREDRLNSMAAELSDSRKKVAGLEGNIRQQAEVLRRERAQLQSTILTNKRLEARVEQLSQGIQSDPAWTRMREEKWRAESQRDEAMTGLETTADKLDQELRLNEKLAKEVAELKEHLEAARGIDRQLTEVITERKELRRRVEQLTKERDGARTASTHNFDSAKEAICRLDGLGRFNDSLLAELSRIAQTGLVPDIRVPLYV
jgi:chromosome segregation ATPase